MKHSVKIIEAIGILLTLVSGMAFNSKHHLWGIWLGVAAGCIVLIGIGIWLTIGTQKPQESSIDDAIDSLSSPHSPLTLSPSAQGEPLTTPTPPEPLKPITPQQTFNVTSNNQQGGVTAGIVNIGTQDRQLTPQQQTIIGNAVTGNIKSPIRFVIESTSHDAKIFVRYIGYALESAGCTTDHNAVFVACSPMPLSGLWVVGDASNSSESQALVDALNQAQLNVHLGNPPVSGTIGGNTRPLKGTIALWIGLPE